MSVKGGRDLRRGTSPVLYDHLRHRDLQFMFHNQRDRPRRHRFRGIVMPVVFSAGKTYEQVSLHDMLAVRPYARDLFIPKSVRSFVTDLFKQTG